MAFVARRDGSGSAQARRLAIGGCFLALAAGFVACGGSSPSAAIHPINGGLPANSAAVLVDGGAADAASGANSPTPGPALSAAAPPVDPFDDPHYATASRLDFDVIRAHPIGSRMGKAIAKIDPMFALATKASGINPLQDVDSVVWLGDGPARGANKTQIVTHHIPEAQLHAALLPLAQKVEGKATTATLPTDPTQPFDAKIGVREVQGMEPHPGSLVFVPKGKMDVWTGAFTGATFLRHSTPKEAFLLRVNDPGKSFSYVPKTVVTGRMEVDSKDDGGVEILIAAACADEAGAKVTAKAMADMILKTNVFPIRLMTKNVLDTAKITQTGADVLVTIEATKTQVEALARIVADELNTDMD